MRIPKRMPKRISIRALLLLTAAVAILLSVARFRPQPQIMVRFEPDQTISVDGAIVESAELRPLIDREKFRRKLWLQDSQVVLMLPESILMNDDDLIESPKSLSKTFDDLLNPKPKQADKYVIPAWEIFGLLKKHNLNGMDDWVIGGVAQDNPESQPSLR